MSYWRPLLPHDDPIFVEMRYLLDPDDLLTRIGIWHWENFREKQGWVRNPRAALKHGKPRPEKWERLSEAEQLKLLKNRNYFREYMKGYRRKQQDARRAKEEAEGK